MKTKILQDEAIGSGGTGGGQIEEALRSTMDKLDKVQLWFCKQTDSFSIKARKRKF